MRVSNTISPKVAESLGYATFNECPHLCIDADGDAFTISVRTPSGKKVTFCFLNASDGDDYESVDVDFHNSGLPTVQNGDIALSPFDVVGFCKGSTSFDTRKLPKKPSLITVLLSKLHYAPPASPRQTHQLVDEKTGEPIAVGEVRSTGRSRVVVKGWSAPRHEASSGRVHVSVQGECGIIEYYPNVIGAKLVPVDQV